MHRGVVCRGSCRQWARLRPPQLEQVMRQRDEGLLCRHLRQGAEREAPKTARLFGLCKHRLDNGLAPLVGGLPGRASPLVPHLFGHARLRPGATALLVSEAAPRAFVGPGGT